MSQTSNEDIRAAAERMFPNDRLAQQAFEIGFLQAQVNELLEVNQIMTEELKQSQMVEA